MIPRLIAFVDRDGTLVHEPEDQQVDAIAKVRLVDGVIPALLKIQRAGYELVLVSNQDGLGSDSFPLEDFTVTHHFILDLFRSQGIEFSQEFICPHLPAANCDCRKPRTGLLTGYLMKNVIDNDRSCVIGDRDSDLQLADALGIKGFKLGSGSTDYDWARIAQALMGYKRTAQVRRHTTETRIDVSVDLDSDQQISVVTGLGFFDHMIEQLAKHGGFALSLSCDGDLQTGPHHTIEDTALALGEALRLALGNKLGIERYGFVLPMDEALSSVAIDLSGRPYAVLDMNLQREMVGDMPTEMVSHFFHSFCQTLGANLHVTTTGSDTHHQVESAFKATGRCLQQAIRKTGTSLPSTKGQL